MSGENSPPVLRIRFKPDPFNDHLDYDAPPRIVESPFGKLYVYRIKKGGVLPHGTHYGSVFSVLSDDPLMVEALLKLGIEENSYKTNVERWLRKQGYEKPFRIIEKDQASTETVSPEDSDGNKILEFMRRNNPFHRDPYSIDDICNGLAQEGEPMKVMRIRRILKRLEELGKLIRKRGNRNKGLYRPSEEIDLVESYH